MANLTDNITAFERGSRVRWSALALQNIREANAEDRGTVQDVVRELVMVRWDGESASDCVRAIHLAYGYYRKPGDPKGWRCRCCRQHNFTRYYFQNWDTDLYFTCGCGRRYKINSGKAVLQENGNGGRH